jgi:allantoinase
MKAHDDFFQVWGGISGVQHLLAVLLDMGLEIGLVARLTAEQVASRFRLGSKGRIAVGYDADLTLVGVDDPHDVSGESLFYRHRVSPYVGRRLQVRVRRTILRGHTVFCDGRLTTTGGGRLLKPR